MLVVAPGGGWDSLERPGGDWTELQETPTLTPPRAEAGNTQLSLIMVSGQSGVTSALSQTVQYFQISGNSRRPRLGTRTIKVSTL